MSWFWEGKSICIVFEENHTNQISTWSPDGMVGYYASSPKKMEVSVVVESTYRGGLLRLDKYSSQVGSKL